MKTFGPLYAGSLQYYHNHFLPIVEVGTTQETEGKYRKGKCLVFRVPFTKPGYYAGVFYKNLFTEHLDDDEIDAILYGAMKSRTAWTPEDGYYDETF